MNEYSPLKPEHHDPDHAEQRARDREESRDRVPQQDPDGNREEQSKPDIEPPAPDDADAGSDGAKARARQRRWFGLVVLVLLIAGVAYGAFTNLRRSQAAVEARNAYRDIVPVVQTAEIKAAAPVIDVTLPAETLAYDTANIYARANGYIESRKVDIGDQVRNGDVLAKLTAPELDYQIAQAEATQAQAQANVAQTESNRQLAQATNARSSVLVNQGWVTRQQGDQDRLGLSAQQAALGAAKANDAASASAIKVLRQQREYLTVQAPFDGIVTRRNVDVGDLVQTGATLLFTVQKTDVIRVQVHVPQDQAFDLTPGAEVSARVPELPGRTFPGKVTRMSVSLDNTSRTLLAEADVPNPDGALRAGAYVLVTLHIPRKTPAVILPSSALIFNKDGQQAMIVENDVGRLRKLTVARDYGASLEVDTGLNPGDTVVLNPTADLMEGQKLKTAAPQPPKASGSS